MLQTVLTFLFLVVFAPYLQARVPACELTSKCQTRFLDYCEKVAPYEVESQATMESLSASVDADGDCRVMAEKLFELKTLKLVSVKDITALTFLEPLEELTLKFVHTADIRPLRSLKNLRSLNLSAAHVSKYEFLTDLKNLEAFRLSEGHFDATYFSKKPALKHLFLYGLKNRVDLKVVGALSQLRTLSLGYSKVNNFEDLAGLKNLEVLSVEIYPNFIIPKTTDFLSGFSKLKMLNLSGLYIPSVNPISNLKGLKVVSLPLAAELALHLKKEGLPLLSDIAPLKNLTSLEYLSLSGNEIKDIVPITSCFELTYLGLNQVPVTQWDLVNKLPKLKELSTSEAKCPATVPGSKCVFGLSRSYQSYYKELGVPQGLLN